MQKKIFNNGLLISFEGIEGVGKTTQTQLLWEALSNAGYTCYLTREPGGTDFGDAIRPCLLADYATPLDAQTELCLLLASRRHHLQTVIAPMLNKGAIVIVDRFIDASIAYQGYGRGLSLELIHHLHDLLEINISPAITFLLDIPLETSRQRLQRRGFFDRIEREHNPFFERVREGYLTLAQQNEERITVIDACATRDHIAQLILNKVLRQFNA
jgi:dTMP kinase